MRDTLQESPGTVQAVIFSILTVMLCPSSVAKLDIRETCTVDNEQSL